MSANSLGDIPKFFEGNILILFKTDSESNSLAASYWITFPNKIRQDIFFILQEWFWKSFEMIFNSLEYPSIIPSVNSGTFNWSCSSQKCSIHNRPLKTGHLTHLAEKNGLKLWQMAFVRKELWLIIDQETHLLQIYRCEYTALIVQATIATYINDGFNSTMSWFTND